MTTTIVPSSDQSEENASQYSSSSSEDEADNSINDDSSDKEYFIDVSPSENRPDLSLTDHHQKRRIRRFKKICKQVNIENNSIKISKRKDCLCCTICNRSFLCSELLLRNIKRHLNGTSHQKRIADLKREMEIDASIAEDPYLTDEKDTPNAKKKISPKPRKIGTQVAYRAAKVLLKHCAPIEAAKKGKRLEYEIMSKIGRQISSETIRKVGLPFLVQSNIILKIISSIYITIFHILQICASN